MNTNSGVIVRYVAAYSYGNVLAWLKMFHVKHLFSFERLVTATLLYLGAFRRPMRSPSCA